ncbi:MAG: CPBP family intramembrane metalloprotease [Gemmatimonadetes bacterium]|nr:CPBP family intramembrane metalloprotease [Gemmatimonadota bacterium]
MHGPLDHLLALTFAVVFPVVATPVYRRRRPALLAGDLRVRRREFVETLVWLAAMGVCTVVVWTGTGRALTALGLTVPAGRRGWLGMTLAGVAAMAPFVQTWAVRRDPTTREAARTAFEGERDFLPTGRSERRLFWAIALAAGVGEELFFRGFLIAYGVLWLPTPATVVVSSVLFGLVHVMHGSRATLRATGLGLVLAVLYVWSGSLWPSILLHTGIDWSSAESGYFALGDGC